MHCDYLKISRSIFDSSFNLFFSSFTIIKYRRFKNDTKLKRIACTIENQWMQTKMKSIEFALNKN